jgi:putative ABC transport system substrate-binding protein
MRRIGVLMLYPENDPQGQLRATAFRQGLEKLGWSVGRNVQIDFQWGLGDADWIRSAAAQLLRLAPNVILANGSPAARTMQQASRTVPVIFIAGSDPVADGLVPSLATAI